jgi:tetratricopeptide (TPR) repeat protein
MYETLPARFVDPLAHPVFVPERTEEIAAPSSGPGRGVPSCPDGEAGSFLDLLAAIERVFITDDNRSDIIARYESWIERNGAAATTLYAGWFNLGVELAAAGDKAGAIDAYHSALAHRPSFYPAALNLGSLMESTGQPEAALAIWQQAMQPDEARTTLLDYRDSLAASCRIEQQDMTKVLHVGCGAYDLEELPPVFRCANWQEIRLDIDPTVRPDFIASVTDMHVVSDGLVDAVYSSHTLKHLYPHEVSLALHEMHRVLKPTGFTFIRVPDLQEMALHVAEGNLEEPLYMSPMGPIAPLDILYGHRAALASGKAFAAPRTGFTSATIGTALIRAGFAAVIVQREASAFRLTAIAFRSRPDKEQLATAQAQMLSAPGHSAVLYTSAD